MSVRAALGAAALVCAVAACDVSGSEASDGDVARFALDAQQLPDIDISGYTLDMMPMRQWMAGARALTQAAHTDSVLAAALAPSDRESVLASIIRLEHNRRAHTILADVGLTPREYVMTAVVYFQAVKAEEAARSTPPGRVPPNVNPLNVAFVREHRAELDRLSSGQPAPIASARGRSPRR